MTQCIYVFSVIYRSARTQQGEAGSLARTETYRWKLTYSISSAVARGLTLARSLARCLLPDLYPGTRRLSAPAFDLQCTSTHSSSKPIVRCVLFRQSPRNAAQVAREASG